METPRRKDLLLSLLNLLEAVHATTAHSGLRWSGPSPTFIKNSVKIIIEHFFSLFFLFSLKSPVHGALIFLF